MEWQELEKLKKSAANIFTEENLPETPLISTTDSKKTYSSTGIPGVSGSPFNYFIHIEDAVEIHVNIITDKPVKTGLLKKFWTD
ncbi:MAG TPA: hypothetical protein PL110_00705 [Candidatus Eremiobacteraeota bacterium]|nr:MAG: hypothetical protein BWY64_00016 [bacterium ADurb.Bin363]HPZ06607.1 hypothetical protein [Candidatus Eremiobacteraeota bacterium]